MFANKSFMAIAVAAVLAGCGGGTEEDSPAPTPVSGKMVDGYVSGATVFCDLNGNGTLDAGEGSTTTSATGDFVLAAGCSAKLVGSGGTDMATGHAFTGRMQAPAGSTVITPLTTLLATSTLTAPQLATLLGLPAGTDVRTADPANGQNAELQKKTLAVQQVMSNLTKLLAEKTGSTDTSTLYASVAAGVAATLVTAAASPTASTDAPLISSTGVVNDTLLSTIVKELPAVRTLTNITAADLDATINVIAAEAQTFAQASTQDLVALATQLQNPVKPSPSSSAASSYLSMVSDSVKLNGSSTTLSAFQQGTTVSGLSSIGLNLAVTGTPAADTTGSMALQLTERGGSSRKLQLMIDQVNLKVSASGVVSVSVPTGAKVYAYGHMANGTDVNLTLSDLSFTPISVVDNGFTLNYTNMVQKVLASAQNTSRVTAEQFVALKGTFDVKLAVSKLNVRKADGSAFNNQTISVTNSSQSVTGAGFEGVLTIQ